jgi:ubiquinone/menaquinone biosynthesis C-methylase UbiE
MYDERQSRLCDYEGSSYRTDFWEGQGREYEDLAERIALNHLLPATGRRLLDIGAGFGRLSDYYSGYEQVVLLDYSRSLLKEAQSRLGRDGRMVYVATSFYSMPFVDGAIDSAMMVRVMHHVEHVPDVLSEVARALSPNGNYVLEFASKRHLKSILRYALGRQDWSPFEPSPYEFTEMNFDFHPDWMRDRLHEAGFHVKHTRSVSHFRLPALKRLVPAPLLAKMDGLCQPTGAWWLLAPSVFVGCVLEKPGFDSLAQTLFQCPVCKGLDLRESTDLIYCTNCAGRWAIEDGIYNFKAPLSV